MKYWRDALEVVGALCVIAAAFYAHPAFGVAIAGGMMIVAANVVGGTDAHS